MPVSVSYLLRPGDQEYLIDVPSIPESHGIAPAAHRRSSSDRGRDGLKVDSLEKHEKDKLKPL